jgi:hypothetical protein
MVEMVSLNGRLATQRCQLLGDFWLDGREKTRLWINTCSYVISGPIEIPLATTRDSLR